MNCSPRIHSKVGPPVPAATGTSVSTPVNKSMSWGDLNIVKIYLLVLDVENSDRSDLNTDIFFIFLYWTYNHPSICISIQYMYIVQTIFI
jgi:hypothetical protein